MKKLILLLLTFVITTCTDSPPFNLTGYIRDMIAITRSGHIDRKTYCVMKYAEKYFIDPIVFTKLGLAESSFISTQVNKWSGAVGLFGIMPKYWKHLPYHVIDGKYKNYLHKHKGTNYLKVMKFIEANTQMGAIVLSTYLKRHNNDYREALITYGGWRAKRFKHRTEKRDAYINKILGDE